MNKISHSLDRSFIIFVCIPSECIKKVKVFSKMRVCQLNSLFPSPNKSYFYKGIILDENNTLSFYNIHSESNIFAIPKNESHSLVDLSRFRNLHHNYDDLSESIRYAMIDETKVESARLRDLQLTRIEGKTRQFVKICKSCLEGIEQHQKLEKPQSLITNFGSLSAPSKEPLPAFWTVQPPKTFKVDFNMSPSLASEEKIENDNELIPKKI